MAEVRDLLPIPDERINAALAEADGWHRERWLSFNGRDYVTVWVRGDVQGGYIPPDYCSEDSPRELLGEVEALVYETDLKKGTSYLCEIQDLLGSSDRIKSAEPAVIAPASIRARAALWVLDRTAAERLIVGHRNNQEKEKKMEVQAKAVPYVVKMTDIEDLGHSLHAALRQCCTSTVATIAWNVIVLMGSEWSDYISWVEDSLEWRPDGIADRLKKVSLDWDPYIIPDGSYLLLSILQSAFKLFDASDWNNYASYLTYEEHSKEN